MEPNTLYAEAALVADERGTNVAVEKWEPIPTKVRR
jgi:hypothetical protein